MAVGRTTFPHTRVYADGYDISGYTRSFGPLVWEYDEVDLTCPPGDSAKGYLLGQPRLTPTVVNAVLDNDAAGLFASSLSTPGAAVTLMIPIGIRAAPAAGDPVWAGIFQQLNYGAQEDGGAMTVTLPFGEWDAASLIDYEKPWGVLLATKAARTAANTSSGVDGATATTAGGYMIYQVFAGNGTATISVDDSADNAAWLALSGATTGSIDCSTPRAGVVAIGTTATIRRYTRWQLALGTATTVTLALALVRG